MPSWELLFRAYSNSTVEILFINHIKPDKIINMLAHKPVILEVPLIRELFNMNPNMKAYYRIFIKLYKKSLLI